MAHYEKYTRGAVKGLLCHDTRSEDVEKSVKHVRSNENIDAFRTGLN